MADDIVTFNLPDGTEVSNDPRFYQRDLQKQLDEQAKALLAVREPAQKESLSDTEQTARGTTNVEYDDDYEDQTAKDLKAEAQKRDLDLSGITRKSELIALLREHDANSQEQPEDAGTEGADDEVDEDEEADEE